MTLFFAQSSCVGIRNHMHCSNCGHKVPKTLSVRTHSCPKCKTVLDRDDNATVNILNKPLPDN